MADEIEVQAERDLELVINQLPLNSPNYMHIGMPKDWNAEYIDAIGIRTHWCMEQVISSSTEKSKSRFFLSLDSINVKNVPTTPMQYQ